MQLRYYCFYICFYYLYILITCTLYFANAMNTGEKIRGIRLLKKLSQENMANMLGISRMAYGDIERGKTDISDSRLSQIAKVLEVEAADILKFGDTVSNFFDQCQNATGINQGSISQTNNYDHRELIHQIEKLQLEIKLLKAEKDKAEIEASYWRERVANL